MEELTELIKSLQKKFDEQTNEIRDMKQSIPQIINNNIDNKFAYFELKYIALEKTIEEQGRRIQQLERTTRKKNLIFFGIDENEVGYNYLQGNILKIINQNLGINCTNDNIEDVRRLGKYQGNGKIRPTIVTLNTMGLKIEILKNKKKLDKTPYYIKEDFPPEILEERKKLTVQMLEERNKGHKAFLSYNKLVVIPDQNQSNYKHPNRMYNKRHLSESPEITTECPGPSNCNTKKPTKKQNSNINNYVIRNTNQNKELFSNSTTSTSLPKSNSTSQQSLNTKKN